jgi:hypothetical protein
MILRGSHRYLCRHFQIYSPRFLVELEFRNSANSRFQIAGHVSPVINLSKSVFFWSIFYWPVMGLAELRNVLYTKV